MDRANSIGVGWTVAGRKRLARALASTRSVHFRALFMQAPGTSRLVLLLVLASLGAGIVTCGCRRRVEQYIPAPQIAESAVQQALAEWQAGKPAGEIANSQPSIFVTDTNRKPKQRLESFQILGETPGHSGRTYVVELALAGPAEKIKAEYIVVGIDPLWVFRREDYELLMHWDHYMPEAAANAQPTAAAGNDAANGEK